MHKSIVIIGLMSVLAVIVGTAYSITVNQPQSVLVSNIFAHRSIEDLVRGSYASLIGTIEDTTVSRELSLNRPGEYDVITTASIKVEKYLSNPHNLALTTIDVSTLGGTIGNYTMLVEGYPAFEPGAKVVVFVDKRDDDTYVVYGAAQGLFTVNEDGTLGMENEKPYLDSISTTSTEPLFGMKLADFESQIKYALH